MSGRPGLSVLYFLNARSLINKTAFWRFWNLSLLLRVSLKWYYTWCGTISTELRCLPRRSKWERWGCTFGCKIRNIRNFYFIGTGKNRSAVWVRWVWIDWNLDMSRLNLKLKLPWVRNDWILSSIFKRGSKLQREGFANADMEKLTCICKLITFFFKWGSHPQSSASKE